jgi:hypothetical protein
MPPGRPLLPFNKLADEAGPEPPLPVPVPVPLPLPAPVLVPVPVPVPVPVVLAPAPPDKPAGVDEGETEGEAKELVSGRFPPSDVEPYRDAAEPDADGNKSPYRD